MVDKGGSSTNDTLASTMKRLQVLLFDRFDRHKTHCRAQGCFVNCFGIRRVIFRSFDERLGCRKRLAARPRGHDGTIGERVELDLAAFQKPLPAPYDACDKEPGSVNSLLLVRYRLNDYSVPTAYGHQKVLVRGYVHEVIIACGTEVIARHPRSYDREDFVFNPLHYLALIEQKANALDQAAPLAAWKLPEERATLRRLLEFRMGKSGKREFVQVLRLMEVSRSTTWPPPCATPSRAAQPASMP